MEPNHSLCPELPVMVVEVRRLTRFLLLAVAVSSITANAIAQTAIPSEQRASAALDAAKKLGSSEVYAFLVGMPKGADLHMHLSGAIYAETFLGEAAQQGLCVSPVKLSFTGMPKDGGCATGDISAATVLKDQNLYDSLVDSFSMRGFVPTPGVTGHDQFFATFGRFSGLKAYDGAWLDEVATRGAAQNEQYLEVMNTPTYAHAKEIGNKIGWPESALKEITAAQLADLRNKLLADGLKDEVPTDLNDFQTSLDARNKIEGCAEYENEKNRSGEEPGIPLTHGQIMAQGAYGSGCRVQIHFLYQVLRAFPPQQVFAQTLLGFEVADAAQRANPASPMVVGINFVQPEDNRVAMADYHLQMEMLDYLHSVYPNVKISLHAGELANGIVPPEGMSFHIREAVELGHAMRIGHGVDVMQETDAPALLKEMAAKHIMVEVNLTSNDGILGVKGREHPLHGYMAAHVPFALSTDDEGVSRTDLTHEYVRAVEEQDLNYLDLKRSARTSIEHSFLAGESLWAAPDNFSRRATVCIGSSSGSGKPSAACADFLTANEKAAAQYELERRLAVFESAIR